MHTHSNFQATGLAIGEGHLSPGECLQLRTVIGEFRAAHKLPLISREVSGRSLRYFVMDGRSIRESCPGVVELYERIGATVAEMTGLRLVPMPNSAANLNVNITPPGGEYRWHYDRNAVTAILYLNSVRGGEVEIYPNYRIHLGRWKTGWAQRALDRVLLWMRTFARMTVVAPREGLLVVMRGDRSLHSVRRVEGADERINIVMSFDEPRTGAPPLSELDSYLFSKDHVAASDPNYRK